MVNTTSKKPANATSDLNFSHTFSSYYVRNSKPLLITMGFSLLYCAFYGAVLVYEFKKMGILDMFLPSK